jgi:hypothetical protein
MAASKVLDFVEEAHLDRLWEPLVADDANRAFLVRCLVGEGGAGGAARRQGIAIDWKAHARIGLPVTLATLGIVWGWLMWGV